MFRAWLQAIRPKTLVISVVPVGVGTALAYARDAARALPAFAAGLCALLIQVGTNLINDYYDFKKGADGSDRVGPVRASQSGLLSPRQVIAGGALCFALALLTGVYLVAVGGWPIVAIGLFSLAAGYGYTGGPVPFGYYGLGDLLVFVFFGLVAVGGTYYLQAGSPPSAVWLAAVPVGAIATAVLVVNNLRDVATDTRVGKRTLAVRFGIGLTRLEYCVLLALAFLAPIAYWARERSTPWVLLPLVSLPLAVSPLSRVLRQSGGALNRALVETARLHLVFGALLCAGVLFSRGIH